ncbi:MAG: MoaD/ThiS family protein [Chloroflexi bacterium]|nr:MoaD/ThiS family protein [Chloroflexota bacterium]
MKVTVKYFNPFREITGKKDELVHIEEPIVAGLVSQLIKNYGARFQKTILSCEAKKSGYTITSREVEVADSIGILVGGRFATEDTPLQEGDEVAFLLKAVGG